MAKKKSTSSSDTQTTSLFPSAAEERRAAASGPVECLGMTFPSDDARRAHFTDLLRAKLKDPAFRAIEGFPIGSDDDVIAMSDPPYYTACPNPFLDEALRRVSDKRNALSKQYKREAYVEETPEDRHDPVGLAHTYHTKISYKTVANLVDHFTEPGDIVLDCFAGSGMTGVGVASCDSSGQPQAPTRTTVQLDLSPAASLLSYTYSEKPPLQDFSESVDDILEELERELGWMYEYRHGTRCLQMASAVWTELYTCNNCGSAISPWDDALQTVMDGSHCSTCKKEFSSLSELDRYEEQYFDVLLGKVRKRIKRQEVLLKLRKEGGSRNIEVAPSDAIGASQDKILAALKGLLAEPVQIPYMHMTHERNNLPALGVEYLHDFFTPRAFVFMLSLYRRIGQVKDARMRRHLWMWANSVAQKVSLQMCYNSDGIGRVMKGVYYVPRVGLEAGPQHYLSVAKRDMVKFIGFKSNFRTTTYGSTQSSTILPVSSGVVDYIFIDPPFGGFQLYSDLNFLWEAFLRVYSNRLHEIIVDDVQRKGASEYGALLERSLRECWRVLRPGRWMTLKFHNSSNVIWNLIQVAIANAGFVVAHVAVSDKKLGTVKQITDASTVRQDLIISAYKPNGGLEDRFAQEAGTTEGAWDFVRTHLKQLPVFLARDNRVEVIAERTGFILFDRMIAFHVVRSAPIPLSSAEFHQGLAARFPERDGMYFLPEQVAEYDKKRLAVEGLDQLELFVKDESSAIEWLRQQLKAKPMTLQELTPLFLKELSSWEKFEKTLELRELLEQNFLRYDGKEEVPSQIHAHLSSNWHDQRNLPKDDPALRAKGKDRWYVPDPAKLGDLEKLRTKGLMKEFWTYLPEGYTPKATDDDGAQLQLLPKSTRSAKGKTAAKLKIVRLEAVRAGFKHCWQQKDYETIRAVGDRLPGDVVEEDEKLLRYYQMAGTKLGEDE